MRKLFLFYLCLLMIFVLSGCLSNPYKTNIPSRMTYENFITYCNNMNNSALTHSNDIDIAIKNKDEASARNSYNKLLQMRSGIENIYKDRPFETNAIELEYKTEDNIKNIIQENYTKMAKFVNCGKKPSYNKVKMLIDEELKMSLFDYDSSKRKYSNKLVKGYIPTEKMGGSDTQWCYVTLLYVNAKNRYGGYVGFKRYMAYYINDNVILYREPEIDGLESIKNHNIWEEHFKLFFK